MVMTSSFDVLQYITSQISQLIDFMKTVRPFPGSSSLGFFNSYFSIFVGLGVGAMLLDYLLYCFGVDVPSADEETQNDYTDYSFLDDDDY